MSKVTREEIKTALEITSSDPGHLTLSNGKFTLRRGYYYRLRNTPEECFARTIDKLTAAGFSVSHIVCGDKWTAFRGGEGVRKNSHIWMEFKAERKSA